MFFTTTHHLGLVKSHQEAYIGSMICIFLSPWRDISGQGLAMTLFPSSVFTAEVPNCLSTEKVLVLPSCHLNNLPLLGMFISTLHPSTPSLWHLSWWKQSRVDRSKDNKNPLILIRRKYFTKNKNKIYICQLLLKSLLKYAVSFSDPRFCFFCCITYFILHLRIFHMNE